MKHYLQNIRMFFYWGWKLRNNHDWDYSYLFDMITLKLERMNKELLNSLVDWEHDDEHKRAIKALSLAVKIGQKMHDYDPFDYKREAKYKKIFLRIIEKYSYYWWW